MRAVTAAALLLLAAAAPAGHPETSGRPRTRNPAPLAAHAPPHPTGHHGRQRAAHSGNAHATATARTAAPLTTPAPVPDQSITAPPSVEAEHTTVTPKLFDLGTKYTGDGYVYGSSPQAMDDQRSAHVPGISLNVPLK